MCSVCGAVNQAKDVLVLGRRGLMIETIGDCEGIYWLVDAIRNEVSTRIPTGKVARQIVFDQTDTAVYSLTSENVIMVHQLNNCLSLKDVGFGE